MTGYDDRRERRVKVFEDTVQLSAAEYPPKGKCLIYDRVPFLDKNEGLKATIIHVENQDCLLSAKELLKKYKKVGVLNMASFRTPGGGVLNGSGAQEENLCRRSNLYAYLIKDREKGYPMKAGSFSDKVTVFKDGEPDYPRCTPYEVDIISAAARKNPELINGKLSSVDRRKTEYAIRNILRMGYLGGDEALILSAFGCGAYHNPPEDIASIFKSVLEEKEFKNKFSEIVFAIIDDHNARGEGNYLPFKRVFG